VAELKRPAVKVVGNSTIYLRDVAHVRDGFAPQTNVVRRDGSRGTLVTILEDRLRVHPRRRGRYPPRCCRA